MDLINYINSLIAGALRTISSSDFWRSNDGSLARLDTTLNNSDVAQKITLIGSQLGLVLTAVFVFGIVVVLARKRALKATPSDAGVAQAVLQSEQVVPTGGALTQRWQEILGHMDSGRENDWKQALVEADKLVDSALRQAGFSGDTFGDRLANIQPGMLVSVDGLWWAHKMRNRVAHEVDYFLRYTEARQAIGYYEAALAELHFIA